MLSWRYRSRRSARRSRRGVAGGSSVHPDTAAPVDCGTFLAALTERLLGSPASSHQQDFLFSISRNATRFDQDDAAGLDAERAFDYHLLEKRMLLEAAVCAQTNALSRSSHPRSPSIPPAWKPRGICSSGRACHPHTCFAHPSAAPGCARKTTPRHCCCRTPLIRVNCADAAAVATLPHAYSDCACLPVVPPDKPRP